MEKRNQIHLWYFVLALIGVMFLQDIWTRMQQVEPLPYSRFEQLLEQGEIKSVTIRGEYFTGQLQSPIDGRTEFVTTRVEPELADRLAAQGVEFEREVQSTWLTDILSWVIPVLLFFGLWLFFIRKMAEKYGGMGGFMSIGKSKAKIYVESDTRTSFEDVAGVDEAKAELQELVEFLK
ncbi:MAG: ATP-dependent metallopeptidase FtsH/Yme1/Tma family protein, partial [Candidatus Competibacterales bacterium]|nr:ATP-dependent metallopeptidase FtsH/Yme1/Tma family protein [Candidatus Competibacterales bacterium]